MSENLDFRYPPRKFLLVKSGIREIFACGIRNPGNLCSWNPESGKFLLVESESLALESEIQLKVSRNPTKD